MKNSTILMLNLMLLFSCNGSAQVKIETLEFRVAETEPADSLKEFTMEQTGDIYFLHKKEKLSEAHIASTIITEWNKSEAIEITFNDEGKKLFAELTRDNIGKRIAMILNGNLVSAPRVMAEIPNGKAIVPLVRPEK